MSTVGGSDPLGSTYDPSSTSRRHRPSAVSLKTQDPFQGRPTLRWKVITICNTQYTLYSNGVTYKFPVRDL